jgi:cell division protein ZapA
MEQNKQVLHTTILNEEYSLSSDQQPEKVAAVAEYVNRKMTEIYKKLPLASYKKIAVLAALNIAEELFLLREKESANEVVLGKIDQMIGKIDAAG